MTRSYTPWVLAMTCALALTGCQSGGEDPAEDPRSSLPVAGGTHETHRGGTEDKPLPAACLLDPSAEEIAPKDMEEDPDPAAPDGSGTSVTWLSGQEGDDLETALGNAVHGSHDDLDIDMGAVVLNRETGESVRVNDEARSRTASLSKVAVAISFLRHLHQTDTEPTDADHYLLEDSLANSSNEATEALFNTLGADDAEATEALAETYEMLGMEHTVPELGWGGSWTTAADQSQIIAALTEAPEWLPAEDVDLIRQYLDPAEGQPSYTQHFGVGLLADQASWPEGASVADVIVKNGWLPADDGRWTVSSIGQARINGQLQDIVLTTYGAPNSECGFELLDELTLLIASKS